MKTATLSVIIGVLLLFDVRSDSKITRRHIGGACFFALAIAHSRLMGAREGMLVSNYQLIEQQPVDGISSSCGFSQTSSGG